VRLSSLADTTFDNLAGASREFGKNWGPKQKDERRGALVSLTLPVSGHRCETSVVCTKSACVGQPRGRPASLRRSTLGSIVSFARA